MVTNVTIFISQHQYVCKKLKKKYEKNNYKDR